MIHTGIRMIVQPPGELSAEFKLGKRSLTATDSTPL